MNENKNQVIDENLYNKLEVHKCICCYDAPCSKLYKNINPERIIRAIKFDNIKGARSLIRNEEKCFEKDSTCNQKCPLNVNIDKIIKDLINETDKIENIEDIDVSTEICGVKLENPFMLSSSIVGSTYEMCKRALEFGWAGVVTKTICMMPIYESSPRFSAVKDWDGTFLGFKNIEQLSEHSVEENMNMIKMLKEEFPTKVIIASIMGRDEKEWEYLTKEVTKAGADLIELNFSCPNMKHKGTGSDVGQNPDLVEHYTRIVRENTNIPILAKMTPNITDMREPAIAAKKGGANGIAAINTIKSITNIDTDSFVPEPQVNGKSALGGYSGQAVKPIALRFIAEMVNCNELDGICYSGMGGIYTWKDAVEFMLLGCTNVQVTTAIMEYGYRIIEDLLLGLKIFMREKNFKKVSDFVGKSKANVINNDELEKDTVEFPKFNYEKCIGCGRCFISCRDGGHNAIKFNEDRKPTIDGSKCVGCQLCRLVCPQSAIGILPNRIKINKGQ
ncbi:MAG: NAD-dependent dihydropyrimidine dehydrogenase subunit PreA [Clostridia bacterium]|nr:NAD-dependent dihydropyrimidine dehydrogenase subunit PreA [Clostridia bacterium]